MKNLTSAVLSAAVLLSSSVAFADTITNDLYFALRKKLQDEKVSDYKARKVCERVEGYSVDFSSKVISVKSSGNISADMDGNELFSIPEITISLLNRDQAEDVKEGSFIYYTGTVAACRFNTTTGVLSFDISSGMLKKHY